LVQGAVFQLPISGFRVQARGSWKGDTRELIHPGGNPGANVKSISHRCYLREVAFEWELTKKITYLPLGYRQNGYGLGKGSGEGLYKGASPAF
jgi:hypothetical protein